VREGSAEHQQAGCKMDCWVYAVRCLLWAAAAKEKQMPDLWHRSIDVLFTVGVA